MRFKASYFLPCFLSLLQSKGTLASSTPKLDSLAAHTAKKHSFGAGKLNRESINNKGQPTCICCASSMGVSTDFTLSVWVAYISNPGSWESPIFPPECWGHLYYTPGVLGRTRILPPVCWDAPVFSSPACWDSPLSF